MIDPPDIRLIALDLDGTLLNSNKKLPPANRNALEQAARAGIEIVPTTGRFFNAIPEVIRRLPFLHYAITINGAAAEDLCTGEVLYRAELPWTQAVELMTFLDNYPVIYDCYQGNEAFMTAAQKSLVDAMVSSPHYRAMIRELRQPVPELKAFLTGRRQDVQKVQFFTPHPEVRAALLEELPRRFAGLCVSSSVSDNVEVNQLYANKGEALLALAAHLKLQPNQLLAFGDGSNDLSMLKLAGTGVAMENACAEAKAASDWIAPSCDEGGVACGIQKFCRLNVCPDWTCCEHSDEKGREFCDSCH